MSGLVTVTLGGREVHQGNTLISNARSKKGVGWFYVGIAERDHILVTRNPDLTSGIRIAPTVEFGVKNVGALEAVLDLTMRRARDDTRRFGLS